MSSGKPMRAKRTLDRVVRREAIGRIQSMESEALWLEQNIPHLDLAFNRAKERLTRVRQQIEIERNSAPGVRGRATHEDA